MNAIAENALVLEPNRFNAVEFRPLFPIAIPSALSASREYRF